MNTRLTARRWTQAGFFLLFILAPPLDLLRFDLNLGHAYLLGFSWTLGLEPFMSGQIGPLEAAMNVLLRGFLPILGIAIVFIALAWRWGRLYCGWLCPHFSVVETINALMIRASGKPSLWEKKRLPNSQGKAYHWFTVAFAVPAFAALWAVVFLTYLLPPAEIYGNLLNASLTSNQAWFIGVATLVLSAEFLLARHLFCRFACAVGLFQSIAWMSNEGAREVSFDQQGARHCQSCDKACENACPMRLKPRTLKRAMFTCTQCVQCVDACKETPCSPEDGLLSWDTGKAGSAPVRIRTDIGKG